MAWVSEGAAPAYLNVVKQAIRDEISFSVFKIRNGFQRAVGFPDWGHAQECFKKVQSVPEASKNLSSFLKNDTLGKPPTIKLSDNKKYGIDTLRFAETVSRLSEQFGDLTGKSIVELGSNYGGLPFCTLTQWPGIAKYHLIDLPPVQELASKYLNTLGLNHPAITFEEPKEDPFLFVSEYCLTEFTDEDLYGLYENYGTRAQAIFLRCNISEAGREAKFLNKLRETFTLEVTPEPISRTPNKIVLGYR